MSKNEDTVQVNTAIGLVTGVARNGRVDFQGVRYGDRLSPSRFSELGAPTVAQSEAAAFPQRPGALDALLGDALSELPQSDDAFVLRIQAPKDAVAAANDGAGNGVGAGLPVLVFIPGGGFLSGAAHARWFADSPLVTEGPLVLVTVNYRIGALGHLGSEGSSSEANRGLRDLGQALRWVHQNIGLFGGDPKRITLAGDSAGAWYAHALSVAPDMAGLFTRTALISFPYEAPLDEPGYAARRETALAELGTDDEELESQSTDRLLDAQQAVAQRFAGKGMALMPAVDSDIRADIANSDVQASNLHVDALALITTSEEAAAFLRAVPDEAFPPPAVEGFIAKNFADPAAATRLLKEKRPGATVKERMIDAMTLFQFRTTALELAAAATKADKKAWVAQLRLQSGQERAYSPHCFTLPFFFGNRDGWHDAPMLEGLSDQQFEETSAAMREWLLGFVCGQAPTVAGESQPVFDPGSPLSLEIDAEELRLETPAELGIETCKAKSVAPGAQVGGIE